MSGFFGEFSLKGADMYQRGKEQAEQDSCLIAELLAALNQINDWCCYATEEAPEARLMAMQQIGVHARAAIAKAGKEAL